MEKKNLEVDVTSKFYNRVVESFNKKNKSELSHYFNYRAKILNGKKNIKNNCCSYCFKIFDKKEDLIIIKDQKTKLILKCKLCLKQNEITDSTIIRKIKNN